MRAGLRVSILQLRLMKSCQVYGRADAKMLCMDSLAQRDKQSLHDLRKKTLILFGIEGEICPIILTVCHVQDPERSKDS